MTAGQDSLITYNRKKFFKKEKSYLYLDDMKLYFTVTFINYLKLFGL